VRLGWPPQLWGFEEPFVPVTHNTGYAFLPRDRAVRDPTNARAADWRIAWERGNELYEPAYARFHEIDQQVAFFIRGDSVVLLAATDLRGSPLTHHGPLRAGAVLARSETDVPHVVLDDATRERYVFRARLPRERHLLSIEVLGDSLVGRTRFGVGPPAPGAGRISLSDLLLFDFDPELDSRLDAVAGRMLGTQRVALNDGVGVFWEVYGLGADEDLRVWIAAQPRNPGLLRRLGQTLRIVGTPQRTRFTWQEATDAEDVHGRSLRLDFSQLDPGTHTLEVRVETHDGHSAIARREIVVVQ
jgi:hypothetical protein